MLRSARKHLPTSILTNKTPFKNILVTEFLTPLGNNNSVKAPSKNIFNNSSAATAYYQCDDYQSDKYKFDEDIKCVYRIDSEDFSIIESPRCYYFPYFTCDCYEHVPKLEVCRKISRNKLFY